MGRLDGKCVIVTGGTSGIGKRTVEVFAEEGASVLVAARREAEGQELAESLGERVSFMRTDVSQETDIEAMIAHAKELFGRIDCLFNNAGGPAPTGGIAGVSMAEYDASMAVLLGGVVLGMKHVALIMVAQGAGSIINNGSVAAYQAGLSTSMIYSAAKAAVVHLTRCVAMELGESGVRVNSISPGAIATGIFGKALGLPTDKAEETAEAIAKVFVEAQPVPRAGLPDDIAQAAVFLASDESTFVNGHDLVVDGGLTGGRLWRDQVTRVDGLRELFGIGS